MDEPGALPPDPEMNRAAEVERVPVEVPLPALRSEVLVPRPDEPAPESAPVAGTDASPTPESAPLDAEAQAAAARAQAEAAAAHAEAQAQAAAENAAAQAQAATENAQKLEAAIEALRGRQAESDPQRYQAFFELERGVQALFKSLRPLAPAERQRLWAIFKQLGTDMRRAQQEEWESRRYQSIEARESIEERIRRAESLAQGAEGAAGYRRADSILNEVRSLLGAEGPGSPGQVLIGPDRRACWDRWRRVRDALRQSRGGQQEHDYTELKEQTAQAAELARGGDPFQAVQRIKALQGRLGAALLRRGQFEELRKKLSEAWLAAQARVTEMRQERSQHRAEWRERMEGHVVRWRETIEHKRSQREHLVQQIAKLEAMEQNARSDDFAAQVRGWRAETDEKLKRTDELVADLEQRVREALKRAGGGRGGPEKRGGGGPEKRGRGGRGGRRAGGAGRGAPEAAAAPGDGAMPPAEAGAEPAPDEGAGAPPPEGAEP
jgi:hypothetical protein